MTNAYVRFVTAGGFSNLADGVATMVWAWMATLLTRDAFVIALLPVALRLPWFLCALPAGIVADRVDRRQLIQRMDVLRAAAFGLAAVSVAFAMPLPPATDGLQMPWLYGLLLVSAFIVGGAEVFRDNAAQTMMPALVPPERLERANGRLWSVEIVGGELLGPALGAFLIAAVLWFPFALNAGAFAVSALLLMTIRGTFRPPPRERAPWQTELKEGIAFLRSSPLLMALAVITGVWNLLWMMVTVALVLFVQESLGHGAPAYGLILAIGAVGGILGCLIAEHVIARLGQGRTTQWMLLASALAFAAIPMAPTGWALALILFQPTGIIWNTVSVSHRQRVTPSEVLGRLNSVYRMLAWGMMPIGLLLSGALISFLGPYTGRDIAISAPLWAAALGSGALAWASWRTLAEGFYKA
ncbi:MAG: MFS transporter [Rhodobacteraceae bacterium]|nr:MFS transporter [Paracoccaceae bacterium]